MALFLHAIGRPSGRKWIRQTLASGSDQGLLWDIAAMGLHIPAVFNTVVTTKLEDKDKSKEGALKG